MQVRVKTEIRMNESWGRVPVDGRSLYKLHHKGLKRCARARTRECARRIASGGRAHARTAKRPSGRSVSSLLVTLSPALVKSWTR